MRRAATKRTTSATCATRATTARTCGARTTSRPPPAPPSRGRVTHSTRKHASTRPIRTTTCSTRWASASIGPSTTSTGRPSWRINAAPAPPPTPRLSNSRTALTEARSVKRTTSAGNPSGRRSAPCATPSNSDASASCATDPPSAGSGRAKRPPKASVESGIPISGRARTDTLTGRSTPPTNASTTGAATSEPCAAAPGAGCITGCTVGEISIVYGPPFRSSWRTRTRRTATESDSSTTSPSTFCRTAPRAPWESVWSTRRIPATRST